MTRRVWFYLTPAFLAVIDANNLSLPINTFMRLKTRPFSEYPHLNSFGMFNGTFFRFLPVEKRRFVGCQLLFQRLRTNCLKRICMLNSTVRNADFVCV